MIRPLYWNTRRTTVVALLSFTMAADQHLQVHRDTYPSLAEHGHLSGNDWRTFPYASRARGPGRKLGKSGLRGLREGRALVLGDGGGSHEGDHEQAGEDADGSGHGEGRLDAGYRCGVCRAVKEVPPA